jgi:septal ring factor EnvC (AmiA/AmiB activator)
MATPVVEPSVSTPSSTINPRDSLVTKVEKHLESHRLKVQKLQEENQKLKATIAELKSNHSRVRRIPKAAKVSDADVPSA